MTPVRVVDRFDRDAFAISLVVPMRNEVATLSRLIESIRRQSRMPDEVVLVDGGSTDETVALARSLAAGDARFRIIEAGPATPGRGRNVGIDAASFEWIALTDAGIELEPDWLEHLVDAASGEPEPLVVYGNYQPVTNTLFEQCAAVAYILPPVERQGGRMRGPSIASSLLHRSLWRRAGGFPDHRAAEDLIFMQRLEETGAVTRWAPRATIDWQIQPTLSGTFKRFFLYSKHNVWAGRQRDWHYGVARIYLVALPFLLLAAIYSAWWLLVPVAGGAARVAKSLWRQREERSIVWLLNPCCFLLVGVILLTIDAATFLGWVAALLTRPVPCAPQQEPLRGAYVHAPHAPVGTHHGP